MEILVLSQGPYHVAVFKPHNMTVVGGPGVVRPTLLDLVRKMFGRSIFPVHRLDRVTAGITIFARSIFAKHALENAFKKRLVNKTYYAICEGQAHFKSKTINEPLKKIATKEKTGPVAKQIVDQSGEQAITKIIFLKQLTNNLVLLEAHPISGRMHQLRAHLSHIGLPIVGDKLYGANVKCPPHTIGLVSVAISLPLPKGARLNLDARNLFSVDDYL